MLDSGYDITHAIPIYEGYAIPDYTQKMPLGGINLTEYMKDLLKARGFVCNNHDDLEIVNHIKETKTYVSSDFINEISQSDQAASNQTTYEFADGNKIVIGNERI